ncbi:MAG TPA: PASTA domain-containing protein, partial [Longimicrobium sp.]|nr:PASTA domain-containing protein [Longimicrobium sp.]
MDTPFRPSRRPALGLALALLCGASPGALCAQRDTIFFPANPASRPATDSPRISAPAQEENVSIVPSLVGLTVEDARELLARRKLTLGAMEETVTSGVPGTIARQQPQPGARVAPGSSVPVWLVAARVAVMPAIMGLPRDRAERLLRQAGLRVGEVSGMEAGPRIRVISHTFHAGERVPVGAVVNLSLGVPPAPPPPVVAQRDTQRTRPAPPARGTRTDSAAPLRVARVDSAAPLRVARVDSAAVPEVRAMGLPAARQALASAGFAAAFDSVFADSAGWTVAEQAPAPGTRIPAGAPVQLALAPPTVLPPPVAAAPVQPPPLASGLQPSPAAPVQQPAPEGRSR